MSHSLAARRSAGIAFLLLVSGTVIGIAGSDLVLPAVPSLPQALGGTAAQAQLVLAAFAAGVGVGLLAFGSLGARFDQGRLLVLSLVAYAVASGLAALSPSMEVLIAIRFLQGAAGSAAAVFAPGIIRALYGDDRAVAAIGLFGSIEALTPALAPIAGLWLFQYGGWSASFAVLAVAALLLAGLALTLHDHLPPRSPQPRSGGYAHLLRHAVYLRYALSHALTLAALLVVVFGAPTVFVAVLGGTIGDFVAMQVTGVATFIVAANLTSRFVRRFGAERAIWTGTAIAAAGSVAMLTYALAGGDDPLIVAALFVPFNAGLGLRGPPGFHRAIVASDGDDARGAALLVVAILGLTAAATAVVAPFIDVGLVPLALASTALLAVALGLLAGLPAYREPA